MAVLDTEANRVPGVHDSVLDPLIVGPWPEFDLAEQTSLCEATVTGLPVLLGSAYAIGGGHPGLLAETLAASLSAAISLPLRTADGVTLGAVRFGWRRSQAFDATQVRRLDFT